MPLIASLLFKIVPTKKLIPKATNIKINELKISIKPLVVNKTLPTVIKPIMITNNHTKKANTKLPKYNSFVMELILLLLIKFLFLFHLY